MAFHNFSGENGNACDYCDCEWEDRFLVGCVERSSAKKVNE